MSRKNVRKFRPNNWSGCGMAVLTCGILCTFASKSKTPRMESRHRPLVGKVYQASIAATDQPIHLFSRSLDQSCYFMHRTDSLYIIRHRGSRREMYRFADSSPLCSYLPSFSHTSYLPFVFILDSRSYKTVPIPFQ